MDVVNPFDIASRQERDPVTSRSRREGAIR